MFCFWIIWVHNVAQKIHTFHKVSSHKFCRRHLLKCHACTIQQILRDRTWAVIVLHSLSWSYLTQCNFCQLRYKMQYTRLLQIIQHGDVMCKCECQLRNHVAISQKIVPHVLSKYGVSCITWVTFSLEDMNWLLSVVIPKDQDNIFDVKIALHGVQSEGFAADGLVEDNTSPWEDSNFGGFGAWNIVGTAQCINEFRSTESVTVIWKPNWTCQNNRCRRSGAWLLTDWRETTTHRRVNGNCNEMQQQQHQWLDDHHINDLGSSQSV